jgi:hypothetical protein
MAHLPLRTRSILSLLLALVLASFSAPPAGAVGVADVPSLERFIDAVWNGEGDALRGIYVPGLMASWIVPQPDGEPGFVSSKENTLTQFGLADLFGSTGLLAHNYLAGKTFSRLKPGQTFILVYGDGRTESFIVRQIRRFRALDPLNNQSTFFDLDRGGNLTASQLFLEVYGQPERVILQTCIESQDDLAWGRLFVIAEPYTPEPKEREERSIPVE